MPMPPVLRKLVLAIHLIGSIGWVGAAMAYLVLAIAIPIADDPATARAAWIGMELIGWFAIAPLSILSLISGIALALGSRWGLLRHYWVIISLISTIVITVVLLLHLPDVSAQARAARQPDPGSVLQASDIPHALIGLIVLTGILVLNIYKPAGMTRYGWRRRQRTPVSPRKASAPR